MVFEPIHRGANIIGGGLDVVRCRRGHVRMPEDALYHFFVNT